MKQAIGRSFLLLLFFTILCGIVYPLVVTGIAGVFFKEKANGSIQYRDGQKIGSYYIGQDFKDPKYFWGRFSITHYQSDMGTNQPILTSDFEKQKEERREFLKQTSNNEKQVPEDLLTTSASNVDPNISLEAAYFQIERIAKNRDMTIEQVQKLIDSHTIDNSILGTKMVSVLELNLALDNKE